MRSGGSEIRFQLGAEAHDREAIESPGGHGLRRRRRRGRLVASCTFRGRGRQHGAAVVASTGRRANWGAFNRSRATAGRLAVLDVTVAAAAAAATMMTTVMSAAVAATAIAHVASA